MLTLSSIVGPIERELTHQPTWQCKAPVSNTYSEINLERRMVDKITTGLRMICISHVGLYESKKFRSKRKRIGHP